MGITVYLSGHLKGFADGKTEIVLSGRFSSVDEVLAELWREHPALRDRVLDEQGEIRQHVNIFEGDRDVKRLGGLGTRLSAGDVHIFNAVSGG
ncbi:MAG TPA: MoaD/ThiS family protein [Pyrinomonadaceae bacterium]|nr:MoaD/ThiS family protein [Pyrinomonadaceae bacterium]HMP65489.1 MoaD/ThiS family protein [Pyrinomonadaceae bacterium]